MAADLGPRTKRFAAVITIALCCSVVPILMPTAEAQNKFPGDGVTTQNTESASAWKIRKDKCDALKSDYDTAALNERTLSWFFSWAASWDKSAAMADMIENDCDEFFALI